tara:strand:+ start:9240 stop:10805 length:1566 start_codon:yes stop_codon:yes gene_type:complete
MKEFKDNIKIDNSIPEDEYEIDLSNLLASLIRQKILILALSFTGFFSGLLIYKYTEPKWEGSFQIVISNGRNQQSNLAQALGDSGLVNESLINNSNTSDIKTVVKILESPSVLSPIYEYVKEEKKKKNTKINMNFSSWSDQLDIKLIKNTSVLNLSYKDSDKKVILNVLNKISSKFQDFSRRDRKSNLKKSLSFLNKQLNKVRVDSNNSLKELQEFSLKYGLGNIDGLPLLAFKNNKDDYLVGKAITPNTRVNSSETTKRYLKHYSMLEELEALLVAKSTLLTEESEIIKNIKQQIKGIKDSLSRPNEVLLKFRELKRDAIRNEEVLSIIESRLLSLKLESAKQSDPWELISKPTILGTPVEPKRNFILLISTFISFLFGLVMSLIIESRKDLIYSFYQYRKKLPYKHLLTISLDDLNKKEKNIEFTLSSFFDNGMINEEIALFSISKDLDLFSYIKDSKYENLLSEDLIRVIYNSYEIRANNQLILIVKPGGITNKQIDKLIQIFSLTNSRVLGWIFIED